MVVMPPSWWPYRPEAARAKGLPQPSNHLSHTTTA
jgi:hypothetical protein